MHLRLKMLLGVLVLIIAGMIMLPRMFSNEVEAPEEDPFVQEPVEEPEEEEFSDTYLFTTDYLNMRTGPGTEHGGEGPRDWL
jgi:hypothetical protein